MTALEIDVDEGALTVGIDLGDGTLQRHSFPAGTSRLLTEELRGDPPRPEELTNAIGWVVDHLDDLVLAHPQVLGCPTAVRGAGVRAMADVEFGGAAPLPFVLTRAAAEEVFRTVATEPSVDRRHNPGLAPHLVDEIVAASCALVAVMRRLHLDTVTVERPHDSGGTSETVMSHP